MARSLPPLNALRAFEAAGRQLSFSKAAAELHVTPAAISHQIKALEAHLGVALFRREPRRLLLTDAGQRLLPGVRQAFTGLADALAEVQDGVDGEYLTISVVPSLASKWLLPRLDRFRHAHPRFEVRLDASSHVVDFARETDVDLALRHGTGDYPGLEVERLTGATLFPVCSPKLLAGAPPLRTPADLRRHTLLHVPWGTCDATEPDWSEWLKSAGVDVVDAERGPRFNHSSYAIQAAIEGHGVALASEVLVADDLAAGRLVQPFAEGVSGSGCFAYFLVYPPHKAKLARVRAFRAWLLAEIAVYRDGQADTAESDERRKEHSP